MERLEVYLLRLRNIVVLFFLLNLLTSEESYCQSLSYSNIPEEALIQWKLDTSGCQRLRSTTFNKYFKARTESRNYLLKGIELSRILDDFGDPNSRHLDENGEVSALIYVLDRKACGDVHIEASLDILFEEDKVKSHWLTIE